MERRDVEVNKEYEKWLLVLGPEILYNNAR